MRVIGMNNNHFSLQGHSSGSWGGHPRAVPWPVRQAVPPPQNQKLQMARPPPRFKSIDMNAYMIKKNAKRDFLCWLLYCCVPSGRQRREQLRCLARSTSSAQSLKLFSTSLVEHSWPTASQPPVDLPPLRSSFGLSILISISMWLITKEKKRKDNL